MTLEIHGDTRTEVLRTIIEEQWEQYGDFIIDEDEYLDIFYDFVQILCNLEKYGWDEAEAEYRLTMHAELNLDLGVVLSRTYKNIDSIGIIDVFCNCVKESWEFSNDDLEIVYEIKRI